MVAPTRELSVTYGGVTVQESGDDAYLDGPVLIDRGYESTVVGFDAVVTGSSAANLASKCATLEAEFTKPNQALAVALSGSDLLNITHSGNTGFLARPTISKPGSAMDTGRSRRYRISITFQSPANLTGKSGLRVASEQIAVSPAGVKTLRLVGTYTALTTNGARAQFDAAIADYASAVQTAVGGGTWELVGRAVEDVDDEDKLLSFDRVYEECPAHWNQSSGTLNDTNLIRPRMRVTRVIRDTGTGRSDVRGLIDVLVDYETFLDSAVTTDVKTTWETIVLPYIIERVRALTDGTQVALVQTSPTFDERDLFIRAQVYLRILSSSNFVEYRLRVRDQSDVGKRYVPVWNGDPFARDEYPTFLTHTREVTEITLFADQVDDPRQITLTDQETRPQLDVGLNGSGWVFLGRVEEWEPVYVGEPSYQIALAARVVTELFQRVTVLEVAEGGSGGAAGGSGGGVGETMQRAT